MEKVWILLGGRKFISYIVGLLILLHLIHKGISTIIQGVTSENYIAMVGAVTTMVDNGYNAVYILTGLYVGGNIIQKATAKNGNP